MAYFDELLQRAITVRNNRAPASNTADLVGGVLVGIVTALQMLLDDKQDELTFDTAPTADSQNPVTSDGIYQALQAIDLSACEKIVNKVTSINAQSTDVQYPSAKLLYDQLQGLAAVYAPKVHTHPFADIERPANVASVNAQGYTITTAYYSHVLTITADATLHLPTMQSGAAIILRLTIIQDATGGRAVTFDGGAALVFNPYQTDLSLGQANYRCWVVLWFDGVNWAWLASPYVLRAESQFAYTIDGTTGGQYVTVTINGTTMQIQATSGVWQYGYNNQINSIAFTGDTGVLNVDFTNSDGLANITTLADAFKNCAALVAVDFTGCDLSNVATAADCFAGCTSLAALTIPTGTWKPDIDLSACAAFTKAAMLAVIDGLYTYASGTHTVTFNGTAWDALSHADQQAVFDAAAAKGWTTNAVAVTYVIRGTSSNVNGTETFNIQFIQDNAQTPAAPENITVNVDANGDWSFEYSGKKIYSLYTTRYGSFLNHSTTILSVDFSDADDFGKMIRLGGTAGLTPDGAFTGCTSLSKIKFGNKLPNNLTSCIGLFENLTALTEIDFGNTAFENVITAFRWCYGCTALTSFTNNNPNFLKNATQLQNFFNGCTALATINMNNATFENVTTAYGMFANCNALISLSLPSATFDKLNNTNNPDYGIFQNIPNLTLLNLPEATFANAVDVSGNFRNLQSLQSLTLPKATFANATNARQLFQGCGVNGIKIDMPIATFAKCTNAFRMFNRYGRAYGNISEINMPLATFDLLPTGTNQDGAKEMFGQNSNLTKLTIPNSSTLDAAISLSDAPLGYNSLLAVANWLKDLTGQTAQTVTFKTSAWNALTAAEQSNIDTILSGKNWTRLLLN